MNKGNQIRALRIGETTVNLHNVALVQNNQFKNHRVTDEQGNPITQYTLEVTLVSGDKKTLYQGNKKARDGLREYLDITFGQMLDISHIAESMDEKHRSENDTE